MCRTSAPPRRELYELEQTLTTEKTKSAETKPEPTGSFLMPRLSIRGWHNTRRAIYNANYTADGHRLLELDKPWTVLSPIDFRAFHTYAEAATYAFKGMTK